MLTNVDNTKHESFEHERIEKPFTRRVEHTGPPGGLIVDIQGTVSEIEPHKEASVFGTASGK